MLLPWIFFSRRKTLPSSSTFWPTRDHADDRRRAAGAQALEACSAAFFRPIASNE